MLEQKTFRWVHGNEMKEAVILQRASVNLLKDAPFQYIDLSQRFRHVEKIKLISCFSIKILLQSLLLSQIAFNTVTYKLQPVVSIYGPGV